ncbi:hypothetical protein KAU33_07805 [Candidatus Dependentiae bacterium]|nr:hypothetical protein [Candidatus Dependentiae bacterium]
MKKFKHLIAVLIFVLLTCFVFSDWVYSENYETEEEIDTTLKKIKTIDKSDSRIKVTKLETQENDLENKQTEKKLPYNQRAFYSDNKKYKGIANYDTDNMFITFEFFDYNNNLIWKRDDLPFGRFIISNSGNVVEFVGETFPVILWFFDDKGEILNKYRNRYFFMGAGFIWTEDSKYFVCTGVNEVFCFLPDGKIKFNYKIISEEIWSLHVVEDKIFAQTRSEDKDLYVLNFKGELLINVGLLRGKIYQIKKSRDNYILIMTSFCVLMDKGFKVFSEFKITEEKMYLKEIIPSPNGNLIIIKYEGIGKSLFEGFIVLDKEGKLLARKEIVSNKLEIKFLNESSFTINTDKFKYLVEVDN